MADNEESLAPTQASEPMPYRPTGPKEISPYQTIRRGITTTSESQKVVFSDYSPAVMPADEPSPKVSTAAESAESSTSKRKVTLVRSARLDADKGSGQTKAKE